MRCPACDTPNPPENVRCRKCDRKMPGVKRRAAEVDEDEEEDEEEERRPARARRDDDDRPRRRRPSDEDDYDDDDEDDRPRRRRSRRGEDDGVGDVVTTLIPMRNPKALASYYLGFVALIPILGIIIAIVSIVLGILGIRYSSQNPRAKGVAHAIVGIVLSTISLIINPFVSIFVVNEWILHKNY